MKNIEYKILLILISILLVLIGLYLSFGILISTLKEGGDRSYNGYLLSTGIILLGVYFFVKGVRNKIN